LLSTSITFALLLVAFILIMANREKIEKKHYLSLLFFAVPPFVCIILQIVFYGTSLVLNSVVLSLLIVFLNIQNHSIYTDFLTEVNNRKKLEIYLQKKISTSSSNKTFSI
jgi:GGDEF domain-containing protein